MYENRAITLLKVLQLYIVWSFCDYFEAGDSVLLIINCARRKVPPPLALHFSFFRSSMKNENIVKGLVANLMTLVLYFHAFMHENNEVSRSM